MILNSNRHTIYIICSNSIASIKITYNKNENAYNIRILILGLPLNINSFRKFPSFLFIVNTTNATLILALSPSLKLVKMAPSMLATKELFSPQPIISKISKDHANKCPYGIY